MPECACGCGEPTRGTGRRFRPGHHMRLPGAAGGRRRDPAAVDAARRAYAAGTPIAAIAARHGVHPVTVQRWLGSQARPRGRRKLPVPDAEIAELRAAGLSYAQIAARTGMSRSGVRKRYTALTCGLDTNL